MKKKVKEYSNLKKTQKIWLGAAGVIIADNKLLMVRGGDPAKWSIPSGQIELNETAEQACIREVWEETGYNVTVKEAIYIKKTVIGDYDVTTDYFLCEVVSGQITYHDPDVTIEEIAWKTFEEVKLVQHLYSEDKELLLSLLENEIRA